MSSAAKFDMLWKQLTVDGKYEEISPPLGTDEDAPPIFGPYTEKLALYWIVGADGLNIADRIDDIMLDIHEEDIRSGTLKITAHGKGLGNMVTSVGHKRAAEKLCEYIGSVPAAPTNVSGGGSKRKQRSRTNKRRNRTKRLYKKRRNTKRKNTKRKNTKRRNTKRKNTKRRV